MRFFGLCILAFAALGCGSAESPPATTDASVATTDAPAGGCQRVDGGECCEGESHTTKAEVNGIPCTVLHYCSGGRWAENGDDCHFKSMDCPRYEPSAGDHCPRDLTCTYPCEGGTWTAACIDERWYVGACGAPPVGFGKPCTAGSGCIDPMTGREGCATTLPTPVCLVPCSLASDAPVVSCADDAGVCRRSTKDAEPTCLPRCTFDPSSAPIGCAGANACAAVDVRVLSLAEGYVGTGVCVAGCESDGDCGADRRCQRETGACVPSPVVFAKLHGSACTPADSGEPTGCACHFDLETEQGHCANVCRVGGLACPDGSACDPLFPATDAPTPLLSAPGGLLGRCLRTCTTDDDCASVGAKCRLGGGMTTKTCRYDHPSVF